MRARCLHGACALLLWQTDLATRLGHKHSLAVFNIRRFLLHISALLTRHTQIFTSCDPPKNKLTNKQKKTTQNPTTTTKQQIADVLLKSCTFCFRLAVFLQTMRHLTLWPWLPLLFILFVVVVCNRIYFNKCAHCILFFFCLLALTQTTKNVENETTRRGESAPGCVFLYIYIFFNSCTLRKRLRQLSKNI